MASIPYSLVDNKLTADPNDLRAQVRVTGTATIEDLADAIVRPGSTVTKAEFLAMWEELTAEIVRRVLRGESIITNLFTVRPTLTGVWVNNQDTFDPQRHHGRLRLATGVLLRRLESELQFVLERAQDRSAPVLDRVEDYATDAVNGALSKGGVVQLEGAKLKFDPADAEQGVFLVKSTGAVTRIEKIKRNKPSELIFVLPATLAAGTYRLEVRTRQKGSTQLKTAALDAALTVA